ncbi:MAG: nucleoside phosphorylase [Bacteroidales bacterium]|nr:nucleoside phosphorylase [Bacteroidales bacterium]MBN2818403.1 nucleoside phosphorylase [Bacteroidales bacterium]
MIPFSELLINKEGRIYHLNLKPGQVADDIILVGDPGRVKLVTGFFDDIETEESNREFHTVTGWYKNTRLTVMSTGIGLGNIDICMNELDALVNVDFKKRVANQIFKSLNFYRIGTTGSIQPDIAVGSCIVSKSAIGLDGLLNFQEGRKEVCIPEFEMELKKQIPELSEIIQPYVVASSELLNNKFSSYGVIFGNTLTAPGFYGCQGRELRLKTKYPGLNDSFTKFRFEEERITNYEMESSALFGFSKLLGHEATTICLVLANRFHKEALQDYHGKMKDLIKFVLDSIVS